MANINGTASNDTLNGTADNDVFNGGKGNDTIVGSGGVDTYIYNYGDGNDFIGAQRNFVAADLDRAGPNSLRLQGIELSDLYFTRVDNSFGVTIQAAKNLSLIHI